MISNHVVRPFVGTGDTPQAAADVASVEANEWLVTHGWVTPQGGPAYKINASMDYINGQYVCTMLYIGLGMAIE